MSPTSHIPRTTGRRLMHTTSHQYTMSKQSGNGDDNAMELDDTRSEDDSKNAAPLEQSEERLMVRRRVCAGTRTPVDCDQAVSPRVGHRVATGAAEPPEGGGDSPVCRGRRRRLSVCGYTATLWAAVRERGQTGRMRRYSYDKARQSVIQQSKEKHGPITGSD